MQHLDETAIPHTVITVEGQRAVWIAGQGCVRHEVVGEAHYPEQMQRVATWVRGRTDTVVTGWLTPEPQSGFDPYAVAIWVLGGKVGYLPRELAARWQPLLVRLSARYGAGVACQATLDPPSVANQGGHGIVLWLPVLPAPQPVPSHPGPSPAVAWFSDAAAGTPRPAPSQHAPSQRAPVSTPAAVSESPTAPVAPVVTPPSPEQLAKLRADIEAARRELSSVEEALEIQSFGFYKPKYGFESSAQYVARLASIRDDQKKMISSDTAAPCDTKWTVGGSAAEGKKSNRSATCMLSGGLGGG